MAEELGDVAARVPSDLDCRSEGRGERECGTGDGWRPEIDRPMSGGSVREKKGNGEDLNRRREGEGGRGTRDGG